MANTFQHSTLSTSLRADGPVIDAPARWLAPDEDLVLGCECADPSLQIERWGQEAASVALNA